MTGPAFYLYAFVPAPAESPRLLEQAGDDVLLVEAAGIACAASAVRGEDYEPPPESEGATEQLRWVTPLAWRHHEVVGRLHAAAPVVPLKFGTLCPDRQQIEDLLRQQRDAIRRMLALFKGKDEWVLNAWADDEALAAALIASEADLLALRAEQAALPAGSAYFARKRLEQRTADLVADRFAAIEACIYDRVACLGVPIAGTSDHAAAAPGGLARAALLVERGRFKELEARLAALETEHASCGLRFELVGPLPPYSFAAPISIPAAPR